MTQLWIEQSGQIIIARIRGIPTKEILRECHERVLQIVKDTGQGLILLDGLEMDAPDVNVPMSQWGLDAEIPEVNLKRAILVPNTKLAYLARIAFAEGKYRVFYNDLPAALSWLHDPHS